MADRNTSIPVWKKVNLTVEEAAAYTGVGMTKLREISDSDQCEFVLWAGRRRLLKREMLEEYLENEVSAENEENQE